MLVQNLALCEAKHYVMKPFDVEMGLIGVRPTLCVKNIILEAFILIFKYYNVSMHDI